MSKKQKQKYGWRSMKIANIINTENLHIFWATWGIPMKFSRKMWLMIIIKSQKSRISFTLSLEDTVLEKAAFLGLQK